MITEAIDFRYLLLENYKQLKLNETEVATVFLIDHLINLGNPMITADLLALKMTMKTSEIDKVLASLLEKGVIDYVLVNKALHTTLDPLKKKLYKQFQINLANENSINLSKKTEESLNNIFSRFQEHLGRTLSPLEVSKIREWVALGYTEDNILSALKEAVKKNKKSLRSVDKILIQMASRDDVEKEGHSFLDDKWNKNIEETIRIAQTPWLDDDIKK